MKKTFFAYIGGFNHLFGSPLCGGDLPEVQFDFCNPEVRLSEIRRIFVARMDAQPLADVTDQWEWIDRLSQVSESLQAIRALTVSGEKALPVVTRKDISDNRKKTMIKEHTISAIIDEVNETNDAFFRAIENGKYYRIWYETQGRLLFGGNEGIVAQVAGDMVLQRGSGNVMYYALVAQWKNLHTESFVESPIFEETISCGDITIEEVIVDLVEPTAITVSWAAQPGSTYEWATSTSFVVPTEAGTPVATNSVTITGLTPSTNYWIWVRAVCSLDDSPGLWCLITQGTDAATPSLPVTDGLVGHYIASEGVHSTSGHVDQWEDLSGMDNHLLSSGAAASIMESRFGSEPAIVFSGLTTLKTAMEFNGIDGGDAVSIYAIISTPAAGAGYIPLMEYANPGFASVADGFKMGVDRTAGTFKSELKGDVGLNGGLIDTNLAEMILHEVLFDKSNADEITQAVYYVGGASGASGSSGSNNTNDFGLYQLTIGSDNQGLANYTGDIGCILIYNRRLTELERSDVVDYLKGIYPF